jgi:murein DD-endopeptidase MepM/ murein hydrolase activator NlpD
MTVALALLLAGPARAAAVFVAPQDFERFSVLTAPGPEEPSPEIVLKSRRLVYFEHHAQPGETSAGKIAKVYGTTTRAIQATNDNEFIWAIKPGTSLTVVNRDGQLYEVQKASETLDAIVAEAVKKFHPPEQKGRRLTDEERRQLLKELIVKENNLPGVVLLSPYELERGDRLLIPNITPRVDTYHYPFGFVRRISSGYGSRFHPILKRMRRHEGLDIPKPYGTPVYPARDGVVIDAGWHEGYGQMIVIRHKGGETSRYGHLSKILVKPGDYVRRDITKIGRVGSTGISTGPHLHFEVRDRNGNPVNPVSTIGKKSVPTRRRKE